MKTAVRVTETAGETSSSRAKFLARHWDWIVLAAVVILIGIVRVRLLSIPLERDEGEYAYMGQLMLQGVPPYKLAYSMKFPGAYIAYALIMGLFGQTVQAIHLGLLIANTTSIVLVFILGRRVFNRQTGVVAAATFGLMSVHPAVLGTSAHVTQFAAPLVLGAILLLLPRTESAKPRVLLAAGVLLGMTVLMKQHTAFYLPYACLLYACTALKGRMSNWKRAFLGSGLIVLGAILPIAATFIWLYAAGVFGSFWFWTVQYAREYVSESTLEKAMVHLTYVWECGFNRTVPLLALMVVGLLILWLDKGLRAKRGLLTGYLLVSLLTVLPGWYFRIHYFVLVLPPAALLCGVAVSAVSCRLAGMKTARWAQSIPVVVFAGAWLAVLLTSGSFFFHSSPIGACRKLYSGSPFPEAVDMADYISKHSTEKDTILVLGSEPEICFYSHRRSATGFIYFYSLTENQKYRDDMRSTMISELEANKPRFIVMTNLQSSYLNGDRATDSNLDIMEWGLQYIVQHYRHVGVIDLKGREKWSSRWGADAANFKVDSMYDIRVFERKPD
jgi:hypothetical protein